MFGFRGTHQFYRATLVECLPTAAQHQNQLPGSLFYRIGFPWNATIINLRGEVAQRSFRLGCWFYGQYFHVYIPPPFFQLHIQIARIPDPYTARQIHQYFHVLICHHCSEKGCPKFESRWCPLRAYILQSFFHTLIYSTLNSHLSTISGILGTTQNTEPYFG